MVAVHEKCMDAIKNNDFHGFDRVVDSGFDINNITAGWAQIYALGVAVLYGTKEMIIKILLLGARVNNIDSTWASPLQLSITRDDYEITSILLTHGANPNENDELMHSAAYGNLNTFVALITAGGNPKLIDKNGNTIIHHVAYCVVDILWDRPLDIMRHVLANNTPDTIDPFLMNAGGLTAREILANEHPYYADKFDLIINEILCGRN